MYNKLFVFLGVLVLGCQTLLFAYPSISPDQYDIEAYVGTTIVVGSSGGGFLPPRSMDLHGDWIQQALPGAADDTIVAVVSGDGPQLETADVVPFAGAKARVDVDFESVAAGVEILTIELDTHFWLTSSMYNLLYPSVDAVDVNITDIHWYGSPSAIMPGAYIASVIPIGSAPSVIFDDTSISLSCGSIPTGDFIYQYEVFYDESTVIPEPSTYLLLSGMVMVVAFAKSRRKIRVRMKIVQAKGSKV